MIEDGIQIILDASLRIGARNDPPLRWLRQNLVLARGHYAPDHFEYEDWVELAAVETAWAAIGEALPQRELLYMYGMGGHPGGSWAEIIRAHDLPQEVCLYSWRTDVADVGRQATLLVASCEKPDTEAEALVVENALAIRQPDSLSLALAAMGGTLDEMRTVLPRQRMVPLLVEAVDEVGDAFATDAVVEELAEEAPEHLEPWGEEWTTWLVDRYFARFLPA